MSNPTIGIRSRVVNKKRTDLSKLIRAKVKSDVFNNLAKSFPSDGYVSFFSGHTRFATSSKATLDGTHPQRWSPPTYRRMYNFNIIPDCAVDKSSISRFSSYFTDKDFPRSIRVENYVTHNGDFDFYELNGKTYDLEIIQQWLPVATGAKLPAMVDSACIAGFIDLIRCQGCFGLSIRYAICLGMPTSCICEDPVLPSLRDYEDIAIIFERELDEILGGGETLESISNDTSKRQILISKVITKLLRLPSKKYHFSFFNRDCDEEHGGDRLSLFVQVAIAAFFDNDLLQSANIFLANAAGSFGLCITSSLDAQRQLCLAARGQSLSIALYPKKGIICFGSEQAAVKVGMTTNIPGGEELDGVLDKSHLDIDNDDLRLCLDDLGGEICLLDWGKRHFKNPAVSPPNRNLTKHRLMNGRIEAYLLQESRSHRMPDLLYHRMTRLTRNQFIKPLPVEAADPVLKDIQDIPRICHQIQTDWKNMNKTAMSFNRLTAWNLARCIRKKMDSFVDGTVESPKNAIDILLTGCEVSLWLAEQIASDLQKSFPALSIISVSSNKLLGLYGQEICIPTIGYPLSDKTSKLDNAIVIIVSHSAGTFSPLAVSNLLNTNANVFVVTSEWDCQIGKQLRSMHSEDDNMMLLFNSRVFTTDIDIRPAEPCSISVAATQQLLTCIFQHISIIILSNQRYRHASGAVITEHDLRILERCNEDNISALEKIVGVDRNGDKLPIEELRIEKELRNAGRIWANHILENARAYIMTFIYVVATVVSGYPIGSGIAKAAGLVSMKVLYFVRFIDALIYFYLPQINILIIRLIQRRALRHRMVGRTVVIADIPWVSQAADAFLSKIFAVSYSIATLNVLSGNPADHFVHRHTHRVVRGTLIVCGRPDGRLSALTSLEASCCLSVNQASSIQSLGSTAESITIGHNPYKLPLSTTAIFLDRHRPLFLCEKMLNQIDAKSIRKQTRLDLSTTGQNIRKRTHKAIKLPRDDTNQHQSNILSGRGNYKTTIAYQKIRPEMKKLPSTTTTVSVIPERRSSKSPQGLCDDTNQHHLNIHRGSGKYKTAVGLNNDRPVMKKLPSTTTESVVSKRRSSTALLGVYTNLRKTSAKERSLDCSGRIPFDRLIESAIEERKWRDSVREMFAFLDKNGDGSLSKEEFVTGWQKFNVDHTQEELVAIFNQCDVNDNGSLSFAEFVHVVKLPEMDIAYIIEPSNRDINGIIQVSASKEQYFGENVMKGVSAGTFTQNSVLLGATKSQDFSQQLYESRIASMQRFVSMTVMFHQMGSQVESFFRRMSFGLLGYRYDRTHSIMRIATTASPVSGADVRERMRYIRVLKKIHHSVHIISVAYIRYKKEKDRRRLIELEDIALEEFAQSSSESIDKPKPQ